MSYALKADHIITRAQELAADRVCFKTDAGFSFATLDATAVEASIRSNLDGRVKLQKYHEGRWIDCTTYTLVLDAKGLFRDAASDAMHGSLRCDPDEFLIAARVHPNRFRTALRSILRQLHDTASKSLEPKLATRIQAAFRGVPNLENDPYYTYFSTMLECQKMLFGNNLKGAIADPTVEEVGRLVGHIDEMHYENSPEGREVALANMRAKLFSLTDRNKAAAEFAAAIAGDHLGIIKFFYVDMGAFTYLDESRIAKNARPIADSIVKSVEELDASVPRSRIAILMSADPKFFRIYGHLIMFYAQQLPQYDFVFVLTGEPQEATEVMDDGRTFVGALSAFNSSGRVDNLRFFRSSVPEFVAEDKTFFATSRFFAAKRMLQEYEGVYLIDIDLQFDADPSRFIDWLHSRTFSCSDNRGLYRLSPWRRYLAGNVYIRKDVPDQFMTDLLSYIVSGLHSPNSWMLDQNALTYAIERTFPGLDVSTAQFGARPTSQPAFRAVWESRFDSTAG